MDKNKKRRRPGHLGIFNNFGMKIAALAISVVIWVVVNNINDPTYYMTINNVPVKLLHTSLITDQGDVYSVLDGTDVIPTVTVSARRSIIDVLDDDNIKATADVENITSLNTVEIKLYSTKFNSEIIAIEPSIENVKLSIEKKKTSTFTLRTQTTGELADGYELDSVTPEQNQVRVSGPESVVSSIAQATATVNISGASSSISTYSDVVLTDADGKVINTSSLTMNITSVKVNVSVLPIKSVPISVDVSGTPASGYLLDEKVSVDPDTVRLAGRSSVLSSLESIAVPKDAVNVSGASEDYKTVVNIKDYLPDGVSLADSSFDGKVNITVGIEPVKNVTVDAAASDITLNNVPSGYKAEISAVTDGTKTVTGSSDETFSFALSGLADDVDSLKAADLAPSVDVGALLAQSDGTLTSPLRGAVSVTLPDNVTQTNVVTASIRLTKETEASSEESSQGSSAQNTEDN
ncbi:MAG: CdaR family protein [Lachnospiraceae bacterium]|nr:CdaR family protein [Lachnospiraceae bacterium]